MNHLNRTPQYGKGWSNQTLVGHGKSVSTSITIFGYGVPKNFVGHQQVAWDMSDKPSYDRNQLQMVTDVIQLVHDVYRIQEGPRDGRREYKIKQRCSIIVSDYYPGYEVMSATVKKPFLNHENYALIVVIRNKNNSEDIRCPIVID